MRHHMAVELLMRWSDHQSWHYWRWGEAFDFLFRTRANVGKCANRPTVSRMEIGGGGIGFNKSSVYRISGKSYRISIFITNLAGLIYQNQVKSSWEFVSGISIWLAVVPFCRHTQPIFGSFHFHYKLISKVWWVTGWKNTSGQLRDSNRSASSTGRDQLTKSVAQFSFRSISAAVLRWPAGKQGRTCLWCRFQKNISTRHMEGFLAGGGILRQYTTDSGFRYCIQPWLIDRHRNPTKQMWSFYLQRRYDDARGYRQTRTGVYEKLDLVTWKMSKLYLDVQLKWTSKQPFM